MKCSKCQFENPEGMKFCGECGAKMERICPKCNFANPPNFKFCGECGQDLTTPSKPAPNELSLDEKIDKIQRYLPKGLTEKILSQRDRIEGERKQVTVMFCDMEGFTQFTEKLGPEEAYGIMDKIYEILMGGGEAYDRMKEINSNVKVLLSSGYSLDGQASEILRKGCDAFIQKPFTVKELSGRISEILA
jgi:CheY-like chemotaxis protein